MSERPYTTAVQWLLESRHASLITAGASGKLQTLCRLFDQVASIEGHRTELGFERHNDGSDRIDFFARGGTSMLQLNGITYPAWRDEVIQHLKQQTSPDGTFLFPPFFHLEFDEAETGYRLAGIFQNCWPLCSLDPAVALNAIAAYLEKTNLFDKALLRRCRCLIAFTKTFGIPCSFGIMDRHQNILKVAAQLNSIDAFTLESFATKHFEGVFNQADEQICNTVSAITKYLINGPIWINLDIDINDDKFLPRFSYELISPGGKPRTDFSSVLTCLDNYRLRSESRKCIEATIDKLPFGYKRNNILLGKNETIFGWFNHAKISIQGGGVECKSYFGISYAEDQN